MKDLAIGPSLHLREELIRKKEQQVKVNGGRNLGDVLVDPILAQQHEGNEELGVDGFLLRDGEERPKLRSKLEGD